MTLGTIILVIGIIAAVLGGLNIIRFDGSISRVVISGIVIVVGLSCILVGQGMRDTKSVEYTIVQIESLNNNDTRFRVTLKSDEGSTILYMDDTQVTTFKGRESIELTAAQIAQYRE